MGDPDDGEMIGMTNNEVKKYAAVEETNGRINTHIISPEQVSHLFIRPWVRVTRGYGSILILTFTSTQFGTKSAIAKALTQPHPSAPLLNPPQPS